MTGFEKWRKNEWIPDDPLGFDLTCGDMEAAWNAATAAQRERLPCGHPAACVEGGSSDPDAQVTMWCGACVELDQAREEAAKAERERRLPMTRAVAASLRWALVHVVHPVYRSPTRNRENEAQFEFKLAEAEALLEAIKEAADDTR